MNALDLRSPGRLLLVVLAVSLACGAPEEPRVLTAAKDLPVGTTLTPELLDEKTVASRSEAGPGALLAEERLGLTGRTVRVALSKGDVVSAAALAAPGEPVPLTTTIPAGMRAFPVAVSGADHLRPGNHVDVLHLTTEPVTRQQLVARVLQDVVVLAVAPAEAPQVDPLPLRRVTLLVVSEEAEALALAAGTGVLQVMLRNGDDQERDPELARTTQATLVTGERTRTLQQKRFNTVQVIRGSSGGGGAESQGSSGGPPAPMPLLDRAVASPKLGRVLFRNQRGQLEPLPLKALRAVVYVEGPRARTVVDYVVENPFDRVLEGTLRAPLPQDASPAFFGTFQGTVPFDSVQLAKSASGLLPPLSDEAAATARLDAVAAATGPGVDWKTFRPARVVGRQQAAQTYERVVRGRIDPALLEWVGGNDFEARVYPLAPKSLKRVVLVYEQTLPSDGAFLQYGFPLPETAVPSFELKLLVDGTKATPAAFQLDGAERAGAFTAQAGDFTIATLQLGGRAYRGGLRLALASQAASSFLVGAGDPELPGAFVYGRLVADFPRRPASVPTGDALFLVDTSLSEAGDRARLAGQVLREVLEKDDTIKRFNVVLFDLRARWLFPAMRDNSAAARAETVGQLSAVFREGATSFESALSLLEATPWLPADATAFLLSDGKLTWGETHPAQLLERSPRAQALRWIAYRFGDAAVNRALFDALTLRSGQVVTCLSGAQVPVAALAHRQAVLRVETIRAEGARLHDFVVRGAPQLLAPGQVVEVAGRVLGGQGASGEVVATGFLDGEPITLRWAFATKGRDLLAARAWAELHVERLLAIESPRLDGLIIALSQHFGLTNRLASLLVLETDAEFHQYALAREQVPFSEVEALARTRLTRGEDVSPGLDVKALTPPVKDFLAQLPAGTTSDPLAGLTLRPSVGGEARARAEAVYQATRKRSPDELLAFHEVGQARLAAGDTLGAVRAISSVVELRPEDPEALRLTGFVLLASGLAQPAAEVLGHLRATRSFEVQAFLEEALALVEAGRIADAARNYELVLARSWARHQQVVTAGRHHYAQWLRRLLGSAALNDAQRQAVRRRLAELEPGAPALDLQVTLHWNVDDIDIDLWVTGPEGERTWYQNKDARSGGKLFWDETQGYGPELFQQARAHPGSYRAQVHYYGNNSEQWAIPAVALGVLDRHPNDVQRHRRRFTVAVLRTQRASEAELFRADF